MDEIHRKSELTSTVIFGCYVLKYTLCGTTIVKGIGIAIYL